MSFYRLFLDDERRPDDVKWVDLPLGPWTIVRSYAAFVETVERLGIPGFVSFDHDLGKEAMGRVIAGIKDWEYDSMKERTGYHCAAWLVQHCLDKGVAIPDYAVHSMNPIGADNIRAAMESGKRVEKTLDTPPQGT